MVSLSVPCTVGGGCGVEGVVISSPTMPRRSIIQVPCVIVAAHVPDGTPCPFHQPWNRGSSRVEVSASRHPTVNRWHQSSMLSGEMHVWLDPCRGEAVLFNVSGTTQHVVVEVSPRATLIFRQHTCSNQSGTWLPDSHSSSVLQVTAQYCNRTRHCASASRARKWGVVAPACALY